jgi:hypothetical protein
MDDGVRRGYGVGIFLAEREKGILRLVLDDLEPKGGLRPEWSQWAFFTFIDLPEAKATEHQLTEREYAAIGETVLARLLALRSLAPRISK